MGGMPLPLPMTVRTASNEVAAAAGSPGGPLGSHLRPPRPLCGCRRVLPSLPPRTRPAVRRGGRGEGEQSEASCSIILGSPPRTVSGDRPQPPQAGRGGLGALAAFPRRNCPLHGAALSPAGVLAALL